MAISRIFLPTGLLLLLLLVSACSAFKERDLRPCPRLVRVGGAAEITQYRDGPGRDIIDVAFRGEIGNMLLTCDYDGNTVESELQFEILVTQGPAATTGKVSFPFFVAIVDQRNRVLEKQVYESEIKFRKGRRRAGVFERLSQNIPLPPGARADSYRIMVGFQLTRQQLKDHFKNK